MVHVSEKGFHLHHSDEIRQRTRHKAKRYTLPYQAMGEKALWQAVVVQALLDVLSQARCVRLRRAKKQAMRWFSKSNEDFLEVCAFAELDPDFVIRGMKRALHRYKGKQGDSVTGAEEETSKVSSIG